MDETFKIYLGNLKVFEFPYVGRKEDIDNRIVNESSTPVIGIIEQNEGEFYVHFFNNVRDHSEPIIFQTFSGHLVVA